jgi:hypothetical protein|tara:strand:+ start:696 stop:1541 length:846 start_codon:yes stop_codon:yes gene_type:complete
MKAKHSKYKNTGILFELLVRQITSDTINGVENSPAIAIIREFFKKNTTLKKELGLYQTLLKEKFNTDKKAESFITAVLNERKKLSGVELRKHKYNLIKEVKKHYNIEEFFKAKVENYSENASIFCLFENKANPSQSVRFRYSLIESITSKKNKISRIDETYQIYSKQDKDIRILSYKIMLEKFNDKYGTLTPGQKTLLREYINNISNTEKLKTYLHSEITKTSSEVKKLSEKVEDKIVSIKLNEVATQLRLIKKERKIKDKHMLSVMRAYDLVREVKNVIK